MKTDSAETFLPINQNISKAPNWTRKYLLKKPQQYKQQTLKKKQC